MKYIDLAVTEPVIRYVSGSGPSSRQIAIRHASPELLAALDTARSSEKLIVAVCGAFDLSVGDTRAIWASHQEGDFQLEDFTSIYELLARRPGQTVKFMWD